MNSIVVWLLVKFTFSRKPTKIDEICAVDLTLCGTCQIYVEDFDNFCGLLRKYELYVVFREQDIRVTKKISREIIIRANNS